VFCFLRFPTKIHLLVGFDLLEVRSANKFQLKNLLPEAPVKTLVFLFGRPYSVLGGFLLVSLVSGESQNTTVREG
jgi:hypothetical protein